jgi:hypothetical protein
MSTTSRIALSILALCVVVTVFFALRRNRGTTDVTTSPLPAPIGSEAADRATLDRLKEAGADLSKPTEVLFYLYFATRELAEKAAERSSTSSLRATVDHAATGDSWLCLLKGQMVPALEAIHGEAVRLRKIAESLGGEYDGWEAAVTR